MTEKNPNRMWGGRFALSPADLMVEINASIGFDKALAPQDIRGSKAHAAMLAEQGIITKADAKEILRGLDQVQAEIEAVASMISRTSAPSGVLGNTFKPASIPPSSPRRRSRR